MKFKKLNLYTNKLEEEQEFYTKTLGFELISTTQISFTVQLGWTELSFTKSEQAHTYHYCFLIPSNRLQDALQWTSQRTNLMEIEQGRYTQHFESWNAESFYFFDASGNLAEMIVRFDLENESQQSFDQSSVIGLNEMGMPTLDIPMTQERLHALIASQAWKGNEHRFGTNGDQEAIFLLPNYKVKETWFPSNQKITLEPFEVLVENNGEPYYLKFAQGQLIPITASEYLPF